MRLLRERADARGLFEALACDAATDEAWASGFQTAARDIFKVPTVGVQWLKHDGHFEHIDRLTTIGYDWSLENLREFWSHLRPGDATRMMRALYTRELQVVDVLTTLTEHGLDRGELKRSFDLVQAGGVPMSPEPGSNVVFCWASADEVFTTTAEDLRLLRRIALHFENGVRCRLTGQVEGELSLDGTQHPHESKKLWDTLSTGKISLTKREHGYRIVNTPASRRFSRSLTRPEKTALEHCARGTPFKEVAWQLRSSPPRLSFLLSTASAKLGFPSTVDALRLIGGLLRATATRPAPLTAAERDVLSLVKQGLSNKDIAEARNRSERTIANQMASLLRKTGLSGRRALISLVDLGAEPHPEKLASS